MSKARDDFPEPDRPVMQISLLRGSRTVTSLRLCSLAPWTTSSSEAITDPVYPGMSDRKIVRLEERKRARRAGSRVGEGRPRSAPGPVGGSLAEASMDGIEQDVVACPGEVCLGLDAARAKARAEEVASAVVALVEGLRVHPVEPLHPGGKVRARRFEHRVVVRRHQAERVQFPAVASRCSNEQREKRTAILVVAKDRGLRDAASVDV